MIALALLATAPVADIQTVQRQLDFIVSMCRADEVVRFTAYTDNAVSMEMLKRGLPSVSENKALQCALDKVKARTDLHLATTAKQGGKP